MILLFIRDFALFVDLLICFALLLGAETSLGKDFLLYNTSEQALEVTKQEGPQDLVVTKVLLCVW